MQFPTMFPTLVYSSYSRRTLPVELREEVLRHAECDLYDIAVWDKGWMPRRVWSW